MDYTLCQDDGRIVLQGITIKCNRCKRVMMLKKYTEGMIRKRADEGVFRIWQIWNLLHRNKMTIKWTAHSPPDKGTSVMMEAPETQGKDNQ